MRRSKEEWASIVRRFTSSGLSLHQFCLTEQVGEQSLRTWVRRLTGKSTQATHTAERRFVEILSDHKVPVSSGIGGVADQSAMASCRLVSEPERERKNPQLCDR